MSSIRLVALDLDDTLLTSRVAISEASRRAIARVMAKGVKVTLATGRMYRSARPFAQELGIDVPLITYQGALVKTSESREVIHHRPVPVDLAREAVAFLKERGFHTNVYIDDMLHMDCIGREGQDYAALARVPVRVVPDLLDFLQEDSTKVLASGAPERIARLREEAQERWGGRLFITTSKPWFLEMMNPEATKGTALQAVAESLGIPREQVMAVGDADNDLPMLEYAGVPVAMGNAHDKVKAAAKYVTATHDEDGVARALDRWIP